MGGLSQVWGMVHTVQLLAYVNEFDLNLPALVDAYFEFLMSLGNFEMISLEEFYKAAYGWLYNWDQEKKNSKSKSKATSEQDDSDEQRNRNLQKKKNSGGPKSSQSDTGEEN